MQGPSWIALFEQIPAKLHDTLVLTLVTGAEIMMQSLLRLDSDFAILRGRMAGSTDAGRVIVLPYNQIVNLAFAKRMLEPEVQAIFGKTLEPAGAQAEQAGEESAAADTSGPADQGGPQAANTGPGAPPPASAAPAKLQPPSKSILLARLRARLAEQGKQ
jgi:hypothetical protein